MELASYLVGLTGGIASGKSTVGRLLGEKGIEVVDADALVAELYRPGGEGAAALVAIFGEEVLNADGAVDTEAVAARIFSDPDARRRVEAAIHPLVRRRFAEIAAGSSGIVVLEATRLVEAGYSPDFDLVVTVEADEELRLARAVERGVDPEDARARLAAQGAGAERRAAADVVIFNNGTIESLSAVVDELAAKIARRAEE